MKYVVLVSHGTLAQGVHSVLKMLAGGGRQDILSTSLEDGMGADVFRSRFDKVLEPVGPEDEILLLADIIGGSPLTNALDVLSQKGMLGRTQAFGGMNLPMALTAVLMKDTLEGALLEENLVQEAKGAIARLELDTASDEEDEI